MDESHHRWRKRIQTERKAYSMVLFIGTSEVKLPYHV